MYRFHVSIHVRPAECGAGPTTVIEGQPLATLAVSPQEIAQVALGRTFEEVVAQLALLERLYVEPDGSFVWVSPAGEQPAWQVDGMIYDAENRVQLVDLKGACPSGQFDRLLAALGWPATALVFLWVRAAVWLDEAEFRRHASSA